MNEIIINNLTSYKTYDYLLDIMNYTLKKLNKNNVNFSITLVGRSYIRKINKEYRNINKITDVISFAFLDNHDKVNTEMLGDIFICIPRMKKQARMYGHSEKRELSFLALHGLLHLLGYDHQELKEEKIMFSLQDEILNELKIMK